MRDAYTRAGARPDRRRRATCCCSRPSSTRSTPRRRSSASRTRSTQRGVRLPLMISVTITDRSGRTLSGQTLDAFYVSIEHARPFSVGLNCALGAREMRPYLAELARIATCYVSCYPERRPAQRVRPVRRAAGRNRRSCCASLPTSGFVNIIGGCCGTTPDHIRAVAKAVAGAAAARACPPPKTRRSTGCRATRASRRSSSGPTATSR